MRNNVVSATLALIVSLTLGCGESKSDDRRTPHPASTPLPSQTPTPVTVEPLKTPQTPNPPPVQQPLPASADVGHRKDVPCRFDLGESLQEGRDVICGDFGVWENRAIKSRAIKLHYAVVRPQAASFTEARAPVVVHYGGPGDTGNDLPHFKKLADGLQREVLVFGQRGTYFSNRLAFRKRDCFSGEPACEVALAEDFDLPSYTTRESVADFAELIRSLSYAKIVYFGVSYGTFFGQNLARSYPELVEAIVLDSVWPADGLAVRDHRVLYDEHKIMRQMFKAAYDECCSDGAAPARAAYCPKRDAASSEKLWASWDVADAAYWHLLGSFLIDVKTKRLAASALRSLSMGGTVHEASLNLVAGLTLGDADKRVARIEADLAAAGVQSPGFATLLKHFLDDDETKYSTLMAEIFTWNDETRFLDPLAAMRVFGQDPEVKEIPGQLVESWGYYPYGRPHDTAPFEAVYAAAAPHPRALVLAERRDAATPSFGAKRVASQMGALYVEVGCAGHGVTFGPRQAEILGGFLAGKLETPAAIEALICGP